MGGLEHLDNAFTAAINFMGPVLKREEIRNSRGKTLVEILSEKLSVPDAGNASICVIEKTLDLLMDIHNAFAEPTPSQEKVASTGAQNQDSALEDALRRRVIHALLDLLSLEGIYPSLFPGVGIPLEQRVVSVLPAGVIARRPEDQDERPQDDKPLQVILDRLDVILQDERPGIQLIVLGRMLPDLISGTVQLACCSSLSPLEKDKYRCISQKIIDRSDTSFILHVLSSFLHTSTVLWFKTQISSYLSNIPLRKDGVIEIVVFLASQFAPSLGHDYGPSANGPPITVQAIMQTSRILSSIPQGMPAEDYFMNIGPKLLSLLDSKDPDLRKTAAYVISSGILGKRKYGGPGALGYEIFARPILDALNGVSGKKSDIWLQAFAFNGEPLAEERTSGLEDVSVEESKLSIALERLSSLTLSHANPGILKRLVSPVLLPLWGIHCYAKEHKKSPWAERCFSILITFFSVSMSTSRYETLIDKLLWNGGTKYIYGPGSEGGVSLRTRPDENPLQFDHVQLMEQLDKRIDDLLKLLAADPQKDEITGDVFLHASRRWLFGASNDESSQSSNESLEPVMQSLVSVKLSEKLLDKFQETLSRQPIKVLEIIKQLIESEINCQSRVAKDTSKASSIQTLGNIVNRQNEAYDTDGKESFESLSSSFSLLSTILSSPSFILTDSIRPVLSDIKLKLDSLLPNLPPTLTHGAIAASVLLEITLSDAASSQTKTHAPSAHDVDLQAHHQALISLASPLAPTKAEGLTLLSRLIAASSPILDIPSTLSLLLSLITEKDTISANDEFIYLNAVKTISVLASRHPHTVLKKLAELYADRGEELTLDERLKIGESLLKTIQELSQMLVGDAAKVLGETMISVAGRRGSKPKTQNARRQEQAKQAKDALSKGKTKDDEEDFDATLVTEMQKAAAHLDPDPDVDPQEQDPAKIAHATNILDAWAAGTVCSTDDKPDDLRIRTSAFSILASATQTNIAGLGSALVRAAVDLALETIQLERGEGSAIIRRGAEVLLLDIVRALESAREEGKDLGFGFSFIRDTADADVAPEHWENSIGNVPNIVHTLRFLESWETDPISRGHVRTLLESLEAWFEKSLLWGLGARQDVVEQPRFELGDQLAGLRVQPLTGNRPIQGPRIEEID